MGKGQPLIELTQTAIGYRRALMRPLSLAVYPGDFWGIVGPNGAGKTTLLKTVLGVLPPVSGQVTYPGGAPVFGYVPQRHVLNPDYPLTAFEVALMGRTDRIAPGRRPAKRDLRRTGEELRRVGMDTVARRPFASLSGGQQQRVLLARALAGDPQVLVLDEPTTGMDLPGEADILAFLRSLHRESGITILMIGHHISSVASVADHLCFINKDAGLFETGPTGELLESRRLSEVYGRPIGVERHGPEVSVFAREAHHD